MSICARRCVPKQLIIVSPSSTSFKKGIGIVQVLGMHMCRVEFMLTPVLQSGADLRVGFHLSRLPWNSFRRWWLCLERKALGFKNCAWKLPSHLCFGFLNKQLYLYPIHICASVQTLCSWWMCGHCNGLLGVSLGMCRHCLPNVCYFLMFCAAC